MDIKQIFVNGETYDIKDADARTSIEEIINPEFDDSGTVEGITSFPAFLEKFKSKYNLFQWLRDFKAGAQFIMHSGQIINNCVTDRADLPGSAAQLKVLMDLYNVLNTKLKLSYDYFNNGTGTINSFIESLEANKDHHFYIANDFSDAPDWGSSRAILVVKRGGNISFLSIHTDNNRYYTAIHWDGDVALNKNSWVEHIRNSDFAKTYSDVNFCVLGTNLKAKSYGRTICFNGNNDGIVNNAGDSYYIAIDSVGALSVGYQKSASTTITWTDK